VDVTGSSETLVNIFQTTRCQKNTVTTILAQDRTCQTTVEVLITNVTLW